MQCNQVTAMTTPQQFPIYQTEDGSTRIDVMLEAETLWLNQKQLTDFFGKAKGTISEHIKHIFEDANRMKFQLFGFSEQLPPMASSTRWRTTTSTWCWPWAFAFAARWGALSPLGQLAEQDDVT